MVVAKALTADIFEDYAYFWIQPPLPPNWTVRRGEGGETK